MCRWRSSFKNVIRIWDLETGREERVGGEIWQTIFFFKKKKNAFCVRHSTSRDYVAQVAVSALHNMYFYVLSQIEYLREHFFPRKEWFLFSIWYMLANPGIRPHLCKHEEIPINYWAYPSLGFQLHSPNRYRCSYFSLWSYFDPCVWLITHLSCRLHVLHCSGGGEHKKYSQEALRWCMYTKEFREAGEGPKSEHSAPRLTDPQSPGPPGGGGWLWGAWALP